MTGFFEEVLHHGLLDTIKVIPFLFVAFLLIESMEHYSGNIIERIFRKAGKAGPIVGAAVGCFPQCGFSVVAANLYAGGVITVGTLIATFIATSDEAVLIIMGNPGRTKEVLVLLIFKLIIGVLGGYVANICFRAKISTQKEVGILCKDCGCHEHNAGIIKPAIKHTIRISAYLFFFTVVLNVLMESVGTERLSIILLNNTLLQPVIAAVIGLIPNCAASVLLTQLYLSGSLTFASVISGLCTGAGAGLLLLFKVNLDWKENLKITGVLFVISTIAGIVLEILSII